uniref:Uncharacterized protein n=1 Tax=Siphoviridae sp. ctKRD15 TaxID=2825441 RepID=A0A8S5V5J9_9CAUD|nr:MAG TPA: hypothetical protein [Siphoviridae sp. ctKRD15]
MGRLAACPRLSTPLQSSASESDDAGHTRWGWGDRLIPISHRVSGVSEPDGVD